MSEQSRIAYFYHGDVGNYYYGPGHPMKPQRIRLAHHLILTYKLYRHLEVYKPHRSTFQELMDFHSEDYVDFLSKINPDIMDEYKSSFEKFGIGNNSDCPIYDGIYDFCQLYSGASLDAAVRLNHGLNDICVNWSGGLHHAKKAQASGFCYVNDIVLAILELLKYYPRVLYIDIDVHHGDGVEEAFYLTDRVMTCSFHKFGDYFPGSGALKDVGIGPGKYYAVNIPLDSGIDDESYKFVFEPVITKIMEVFQPSAIVLQCGADSVTGDRLGCFNLSLRGHASCVKFVQRFHVPTLVLGGGGYTIRNVARTWAFETSVLLDKEVPNDIPYNDFIEWYAPTYQLHLIPTDMENKNNKEKLKTIIETVTEHLRHIEGAPSCQLQNRPPDWSLQSITNKKELEDEDGDDREHPDHLDSHVQHKSEYYDDDHDNDKTSNSNNNSRGDLENEKTDSIQVKIKDNGINMKEVSINSDTTKSPLTKNSTA